ELYFSSYKLYINGSEISNNSQHVLGADYWNISVLRDDGANYTNIYGEELFTVQQATPSLSYYLNSAQNNVSIDYLETINASAYATAGTVNLYRNGSTITSENNLDIELTAGYYLYEFNITGNENYSDLSSVFLYATISKAAGEVYAYIDNQQNNKSVLLYSERWLNATLITPGSGNIELWYNDSLIEQGPSPLSNLTNFTSEGIFNVSAFYGGNENYTSDVETWWVTVSSDSPPTLTLNSPVDYYNSSSTNIQFNCTADEDINLVNVSLYGNWTGSWLLNETNSTPVNNAPVIFDKTISDGIYVWNCYACDNISQCSFASANYTFSVDTVYPNFTSYAREPTTPNEDQSVQVNVTITEANTAEVILEWNSTTNYTVATSNGNIYYFNITSGNYTAHDSITYYWYANDTAGNMNKSAQQSFTVANQIPTVSQPAINTTTPYTNDILNCTNGTFSDNDGDLEQARYFKWYNNDVEISGQTS
ncbi:unnamed protein product, partial [marine sediment metagenome]